PGRAASTRDGRETRRGTSLVVNAHPTNRQLRGIVGCIQWEERDAKRFRIPLTLFALVVGKIGDVERSMEAAPAMLVVAAGRPFDAEGRQDAGESVGVLGKIRTLRQVYVDVVVRRCVRSDNVLEVEENALPLTSRRDRFGGRSCGCLHLERG